MKIAISTDKEMISAHFGRCPEFTIIEVDKNEILNRSILANPGHEPGLIPGMLKNEGVSCIIAGGMGQRAQMLFNESEIQVINGISGKVDSAIQELLKGTLEGGQNLCNPGDGKGYGIEKKECDHKE